MWKSTSSNGWEYFIVWKDLGSSPKYINFVWLFCDWFCFKDMYEYVIGIVSYC